MAAVNRKSMEVVCLIFIVASLVGNSCGLVHELTKANIEKFLRGKLLTLTFLDSPSCERCRILYPFFVAASQAFPHDPEIFFTRTTDVSLIKKYDITELPTIIYHRSGAKSHEIFDVDISVDSIIDEIAKILGGNFGGLTRIYNVHVNEKNYAELIEVPGQTVLMLIHDKDDIQERDVIEKLAYTFRKEDSILFADLDIVTHKKLRDDKFKTKETPIVMWFPSEEKKSPQRFGAVLTHELLTEFVNDRTGIHRNIAGDLTSQAGLVPEADAILEKNIVNIMEGNFEDMKPVLAEIGELHDTLGKRHAEMLAYYTYVLENIAANEAEKSVRAVLKDVEKRLTNREGLTAKQKDVATRKKNIVGRFLLLDEKYTDDRKTKTREEIQLEIALAESKKTTTSTVTTDHIAGHEEL